MTSNVNQVDPSSKADPVMLSLSHKKMT